jgi:hypothetical protein
MEYLDFEVAIKHDLGADYWASISSPAGSAYVTIRLPFERLVLPPAQRLPFLPGDMTRPLHPSVEFAEPALGLRLYEALMVGQVRSLYEATERQASEQNKGVRLRLRLLTPELEELPWEYLAAVQQQELCLSHRTPVVRSALLPRDKAPASVLLPLRVLGLLDLSTKQEEEDEKERIEQGLDALAEQDLIHLRWLGTNRMLTAPHFPQQGPWHVAHLISTIAGSHADHIRRRLAAHPPLQVLVVCPDEPSHALAASLAFWGVPAVVSWPRTISTPATGAGLAVFYRGLVEGRAVEEALAEARQAIRLAAPNTAEWGVPALYLQTPTGSVFTVTGAPASSLRVVDHAAPPSTSTSWPPSRAQCVYRGHGSLVQAVGWSPESGRIVSAAWDGSVQVWEATTGIVQVHYHGHTNRVYGLAWCPDGRRIASAGFDRTVQVWKATTGARSALYRGHAGIVRCVAWHPNGQRIASAGDDGSVQVWETATQDLICVYRGHTGRIVAVAWAPDGACLASAGQDGTVQVWEATTAEPRLTYRSFASQMTALAWSPDGHQIASAGNDGLVQVWEAASGTTRHVYRGDRDASTEAVSWSPDGQRLAFCTHDRTVLIWTPGAGRKHSIYRGHTQLVTALAWSPDGTRIASASADRTVQVWQAVEAEEAALRQEGAE